MRFPHFGVIYENYVNRSMFNALNLLNSQCYRYATSRQTMQNS